MPSTHNYSDIFLSYSRRNLGFAQKLDKALRQHPAIQEIWVDWEDIPESSDWRAEIRAGIEGSNTFLFVITPDSVRSAECRSEIEHAVKTRKRIVPVVYVEVTDPEDQAQFHPAIQRHNWFFLREEDDFDERVGALVKVIMTDQYHVNHHTRYLVRATEWIGHDCENSYLLSGVEIDVAERWLQEADGEEKTPILTDEQRDYIETSRWEDDKHKAEVAHREEVIRRSQRATQVMRVFLVLSFIAIVLSLAGIYNATQKNKKANIQITEASAQISVAHERSTEAVRNLEQSEADGYDYRMIGQALLNQVNENEALAFAYEAIGNSDPPIEILPVFYEIASRPQNRMTLASYESGVSHVAFSPDGEILASVGCILQAENTADCIETELNLWDTNTGELTRTLEGNSNPITVSFSPNTSVLASSYEDGSIILWDTDTGEQLSTGIGHLQTILSLTFNADGTMLASSSFDETMRLWNIENQSLVQAIQIEDVPISTGLAFSPDGSLLTSATMEGNIGVWDVSNGQELASMTEHDSWVNSVAFSPDGRQIVSASFDNLLKLWDLETDDVQTLRGHSDWVSDVVFSPDGETIASSSFDATVRLWDAKTGTEIVTLRGHEHWVMRLIFSADGQMLASASFDGTIKLWDASPSAEFSTLTGHRGDVSTIAFHPGSEIIASGSFDNSVRLIDIATGNTLAILDDHNDRVTQIAMSPDGRLLASASLDDTIVLRDLVSGTNLLEMNELGHSGDVLDLTFSPDSQLLVSAGADNAFIIWTVADGSPHTVNNPGGAVRAVAFSPNGNIIATASDDNEIRLWNAEGTNVSDSESLQGHEDIIHALAFNSDGSILASASQDGTIRLWNLIENTVNILPGHLEGVTGIDFSVDDATIASSGQDGTIRLWDVETGIALLVLEANEGSANELAFSQDGTMLASGHASGVVKLWNIGSLSFMRQWLQENRYIREFSCSQRADFKISVTCDEEGNFPTRTPFPTSSPIAVVPLQATWTAEPVVIENLAETVITPFWIPTHTATSTPTPTATLTPEPEVTEEESD